MTRNIKVQVFISPDQLCHLQLMKLMVFNNSPQNKLSIPPEKAVILITQAKGWGRNRTPTQEDHRFMAIWMQQQFFKIKDFSIFCLPLVIFWCPKMVGFDNFVWL